MSVSYTKTVWVNGEEPYINDDNLNHIEQGIADVASQANANETAISTLNTNLAALTSDVGSLLITRYIEVTGTTANGTQFGNITAPSVTGYTFLCWLQPASIGHISALYIANVMSASSSIWCVTTVNAGSNKTVRCTALYQKVVQ